MITPATTAWYSRPERNRRRTFSGNTSHHPPQKKRRLACESLHPEGPQAQKKRRRRNVGPDRNDTHPQAEVQAAPNWRRRAPGTRQAVLSQKRGRRRGRMTSTPVGHGVTGEIWPAIDPA